MIGIKTKNKLLENTLCQLYPEKMTPYKENQTFECLLTDDKKNQNKTCPIIYIGTSKACDLKTPFSLKELETALLKTKQSPIELTFFYWNSEKRILTSKETLKKYTLTQKEAELIDFLWTIPHHQATKEEILFQVWRYHENTNTHTLNTHLYELNQKVGKNKLIRLKKNFYHLF